jgi:hypothetical protein
MLGGFTGPALIAAKGDIYRPIRQAVSDQPGLPAAFFRQTDVFATLEPPFCVPSSLPMPNQKQSTHDSFKPLQNILYQEVFDGLVGACAGHFNRVGTHLYLTKSGFDSRRCGPAGLIMDSRSIKMAGRQRTKLGVIAYHIL